MSMTGMWNDLRFATRGLLRSPGFTSIAVLTLALGIGANTAVFTIVDGVMLSPLPYPESDRLASISHLGRDGQDVLPVSTGLYLLYDKEVRAIESISLNQAVAFNMSGEGDEPVRVDGQSVTPSFFEVLKTQPALGRAFNEAEGAPEGEQSVILSHSLWENAFGADPAVLGKTVILNGLTRTVVGVMPEGFAYPATTAQLYVPLVIDPTTAPIANFSAQGIARLAPGATAEDLHTETEGLIARLGELYPGDGQSAFLAEVGLKSVVQPLKQSIVGEVSQTLWILLGTVAFVLLIACANVANLFMVRADGRHRELALRAAVGASRSAVLRPFLSESFVLAVLGGLGGVLVASAAVKVATSLAPSDIPRMSEVGIDVRVLAFTSGIALLSALLFGIFPLVRYGRTDLATQLKDGGERGGTGGASRHRVRNALVVAQVALALMLLVGSGLMFRSFLALRAVDPGFDPEGVLTARLAVPTADVRDPIEAASFWRQLIDRLEQQPGVIAAGAVQGVPLTGLFGLGNVDVEDQPRGPNELPVMASFLRAESGVFETLGIDVLEGRGFERGDGADGVRAVVISEAFAKHWWPQGGALGRHVRQGPNEPWYEVVGVVNDVRQTDLETTSEELVYFPALWGPTEQPITTRTMDVVVKVSGDPLAFIPVLRREVLALNPRIPIANPRTMQAVFETATARTSFTVVLLGAASIVALVLGLVGIYGVISYVVSQRTREIGVRMALGASGATVRRMVVRQGVVLTGLGIVLGLVGAAALSRVMSSLLFGVSAMDPLTYAGVAAALAAVAVLASWLPALRAAGVDPSIALRDA
jgi:putative ABC transport system permease protein